LYLQIEGDELGGYVAYVKQARNTSKILMEYRTEDTTLKTWLRYEDNIVIDLKDIECEGAY
jgi:hypothetical protein